jgi:hypothetical protein
VSVVGLGQPQRSGKNPINQCMTLSKNCAFSEAVGMFIPINPVEKGRLVPSSADGY